MRRGGRWLIGVGLVLVVIYSTISFFVAYSLTQAERHAVEESPADLGLEFSDVSFASRSPTDLELSGWWIPADTLGAAVIFVHGIHATRESDSALLLTARLVEAGMSVLLFDLRGHGRSGGTQVSGGYFERHDVWAAIDFVDDPARSDGRIGLLGNSMGAATSLLAGSEDERIVALVGDSPFADILDMLVPETSRATGIPEAIVPIFVPAIRLDAELFFSIDVDAIKPVDVAPSFDFPLLLIHGGADTRIPLAQSRRIASALRDPGSELWIVPGADHVASFEDHPDVYADRVIAYFGERFGR